jgi:hypothetical protein
MICKKGHNNFTLCPILPYWRKNYSFTLVADESIFGDFLTEPEHFGIKLPAIGNFNYHRNGMNFSLNDGGWISPRYYKDGILRQFEDVSFQLEPGVPVTLKMESDPMRWYVNGVLFFQASESIPTGWLTPSYVGKRGVAVAKRDLIITIKKN